MPKKRRPSKTPPPLPSDADEITQVLYQTASALGVKAFVGFHPQLGGIVFAEEGINLQAVLPYMAQLALRSMNAEDIMADERLHHISVDGPPRTDD